MNKICNYCNKEFSKFISRKRHEDACYMNPTNLAYCECCGDLISRMGKRSPKDLRKFCGSSCSIKTSNSNRKVTWGDKIRKSVNEYFDNHPDFRNYELTQKYNKWRKKVDRYSIQQLKKLKPKLYEKWQSNPYTGSGDTSRLSLEHIKPVSECYKEGLSVEQAGDISNLEIIPYRENNLRFNKRK